MTKARDEWAEISPVQAELFNAAVAAVQASLSCTLLGLICQDEGGLYLNLRPGDEARIAKHLEDFDWRGYFRDVQELLAG